MPSIKSPNHTLHTQSSALPSSESASPDASYPEGGTKAWLVVLGAWCAMIPSMGLLNSLGTLQAWTSTHQLSNYSESSIGWIYGCYTFFLFLGGAQFGALLDSHGPLYVILPGSIGMILSLIFLSFSQEYYQIFLSFSVLGGISASTLFTPPVAAIGHWFNLRRAFATGLACTAGGVGGCIFPLVILYAAPRIGFEWSIRIIALLCAVLCSIACLTVRTRLPPTGSSSNSKSSPESKTQSKSSSGLDFAALKNKKYASASLGVFLVEFAVFIPITYITSYALHNNFNQKLSYAILIFLNAGAILGRFLPGLLADKVGRFNVMIINCLMCSLLTLILWLYSDLKHPSNLPLLIIYAILFGFFSGSAISLAPVCISQVCEIEDYGKRVGTTWSLVSVGTLIAIPIAGAIQEYNKGAYFGLIVFGGVMYFASTVAFICSRGICKGWRLGVKF